MRILIMNMPEGLVFTLMFTRVALSLHINPWLILNPFRWVYNGTADCGCGTTRVLLFEVSTVCEGTSKAIEEMGND
jgi:hypothetical protein